MSRSRAQSRRYVFCPRITEPASGTPLDSIEACGRSVVYATTVVRKKPSSRKIGIGQKLERLLSMRLWVNPVPLILRANLNPQPMLGGLDRVDSKKFTIHNVYVTCHKCRCAINIERGEQVRRVYRPLSEQAHCWPAGAGSPRLMIKSSN
jgi:hypothetical protein